jgi:uncharacterized membrane protein YphA (DoxX/SURF4 family)
MLRVAIGVTLLIRGTATLETWQLGHLWASAAGLLEVVVGLLLFAGLFTPVAGTLAGLVSAGRVFSVFSLPGAGPLETTHSVALVVVMAIAVVLLGPGAFSLDARLFGRREIVVPYAPGSPRP